MADKSPTAYEAVVDRLLASAAFGERLAQQWLDLARYADSDGYHADAPRSMWQYRDYVIRSFNNNKPFDQFVIEQLAGDLLPNPTLDQRIATAFSRNGMSSTEGGADPDEYMNKYVTDRVNTFGTVFLGSSTACTECHDHKYDQFTQREYYQLYDFFNRIPERGLDSDPAPPFVKLPTPEQSASIAKLTQEIDSLEKQRRGLLDLEDEPLSHGQLTWEETHRQRIHSGWETLPASTLTASNGAVLTTLDDRSVLASGPSADKESYEVSFETAQSALTALRLEALTHDSLPLKGASRGTNGNFVLTGFEATAESADPAKEPPVVEIAWSPWSGLGPFKAATSKEVFEKAFINEAELDLSKTYEDDALRWKEKPDWKDGNEFGTQGELPSHPELLDWLAREFIDTGWNIKATQKKIVLSATYRQASKPTPELLERDPSNRLLARGSRLRLSAEIIRDCALDYAGLLDRKRAPGGPSVKPYQPAGLWEEKMFGGNKYEESKGADLYRRSLYTLWKRTVLNPTMMTFDAPDRAICTEQRGLTCTPLQAFVTLNEKGFVEAARVLAERVLREGGSDLDHRITFAYKTVLARTPSTKERKILTAIHTDMVATYQNDLKAAVDLLKTGEAKRSEKLNELDLVAWTAVANVLLNLDETITRE